MSFRKWLAEAIIGTDAFKKKVRKWGNHLSIAHQHQVELDKNGRIMPRNYSSSGPFVEIIEKERRIELHGMSPQSIEFRKIVKGLKSRYIDIESWEAIHVFMSNHMMSANNRTRTVGYWMSRPVVNLANKMPRYLYHGTSTNLWYEGIKTKGLLPRNASGSGGSYGAQNASALSLEDLVYLSTDPDAATREAAKQAASRHGGKPLIIRIDTTGLDPKRLSPDEDTKASTPQASIDISSTLAYKGKVPAGNIEPFLIGKFGSYGGEKDIWEKFNDVPVEEHPITTMLKSGSVPSHGDSRYHAIKDAGLIGNIRKYTDNGFSTDHEVVNNPENITDDQVKGILKNSGWTQNIPLIMNDLDHNNVLRIRLDNLRIQKELLQDPVIKMLLDSGLFTVDDEKDYARLHLKRWEAKQYAIKLAKMLGNKSFKTTIIPRAIEISKMSPDEN